MAYYRKIGKSWYYTVRVTDSNGLRRTIERFGGDTKTEAKKAALDFLATCETSASGRMVKICTMRYGDYLDEFYRMYVIPNLRKNSQESYGRIIQNVIKPNIGNCTLEKLTPVMIQTMINEMTGKYAPATSQLILNIMKKSLHEAVSFFHYIAQNPADAVRIPKNTLGQKVKATDAKVCFDREDIEKIFQRFPLPHVFFAPTRLAWHTGMRLGECLALSWDDVDMNTQIIHVNQTLQDRNEIEFCPPKTKNSIRIIPFGSVLKSILLDIRAYQEQQRNVYPDYYNETNLVCTKSDGSVVTSSTLRYFGKWCHEVFGGGSFQTLRHSHASYLLSKGWPLDDVAKRLGHSNVLVTSMVYSHINLARIRGQIDMLDGSG